MSGYIGTTPVPQATQHREAFTANADQTTFATAGYTVGFIDVWLNGVKLAAADVTVTNGSDIVLASAAAANDIIEYVAFVPFNAANQTFTGATVINSLNINSDGATVTGIKDEDNMASNDANKLATQQSIKAYVDAQVTAQDLDFQGDSGGALNIDLDSETLDIAGGTNITTAGSGNTVTVNIAPLDEDNMASNSATQVASQQSIKAYVDSTVAATNEVVEDSSPQLGGDLASNGNDILMADNDKVILGTGSDLQFYHDGSYSRIMESGGTALVLDTTSTDIRLTADNSEVMGKFVKNGAVELYHNGSKKFETTSTGIQVTGNIIGSDELQLLQPNGTNNFGMELNNSHQVKYKARGSGGTHIFTNTTSDTERMRIDSSGNLLVGKTVTSLGTTGIVLTPSGGISISESSSSTNLATASGGHVTLANPNSTDGNFSHIGGYNSNSLVTSQINFINLSHSGRTGAITFNTHDGTSMPERVRIDSSGNVLVGKTTTAFGTQGIRLEGSNGKIESTRNGNVVMALNRLTSHGTIVEFAKDGTTVGSIGTAGGQSYIHGASGHTGLYWGTNNLYPYRSSGFSDNSIDIGQANYRFKDAYLSGGVLLGGTGSANKLEDYEEGTWTASMTDTGGSALTMVARTCRYTKIGRTVHIYGILQTTSLASASGSLRVHGLPFTSASDWNDTAGVHISLGSGLNITAGETVTGWVHPNQSYFNLHIWNTGVGTSYMQTGEWSADGQVFFNGHYSVS